MNARFRPSITIAWSWLKIKRLNVSSYANWRMFTSFAIDSNRLYIFESIFMTVCFFFFYVSFLFNFGAMTLFITLNPLDLRARWCKLKVKTNKKKSKQMFSTVINSVGDFIFILILIAMKCRIMIHLVHILHSNQQSMHRF